MSYKKVIHYIKNSRLRCRTDMQHNSLITYEYTDKCYVRYTQFAQKKSLLTYLSIDNEVNDTKTDYASFPCDRYVVGISNCN